MLEAASLESDVGDSLAKERAQQLRRELFTYGGLELTRQVLKFLHLCEVLLLLPENTRQALQTATDAKTARDLLSSAATFIHSILKSKERRNDDDLNAFWATVVSLMPRDLFKQWMVASAMRLLQVCVSLGSLLN